MIYPQPNSDFPYIKMEFKVCVKVEPFVDAKMNMNSLAPLKGFSGLAVIYATWILQEVITL